MESVELKQKSSPQSWDDDDDLLLIKLKEINHLGWKQIAKHFTNRTSNACQFRWRRLKSGQLKKVSKNNKKFLISKEFYQQNHHHNNNNCNMEAEISNKIMSQNNEIFKPWALEEDNLLRSRVDKKLSVTELSILLPNKSIMEIENRINILENRKISIASLLTDDSSSTSTSNLNSDSEFDNSSISTSTRSSSFSVCYNNVAFTNPSFTMKSNNQIFLPNNNTSSILLPPLQNNSLHQNYLTNQQLPPLSKVFSIINQ